MGNATVDLGLGFRVNIYIRNKVGETRAAWCWVSLCVCRYSVSKYGLSRTVVVQFPCAAQC